jgi:hypothetical protein
MSRKAKWIAAVFGGMLCAVGAAAMLGRSSGSSLGQRVNAALDDAQAVGVRVMDLPLFMLLAGALVVGGVAAVLVEWLSGRGLKAARVGLVSLIVLALFGLAFTADRRVNRLENQISELRGKLTAQRMTMPDAEPQQSSLEPATAVAATHETTASTEPVAAVKPAAVTAEAAREKFLIDPDVVKATLGKSFVNPTIRSVIVDRATDAFEFRSANPLSVAYVSVTNLKAPGVEVQYGGNLTFRTLTSDFARANDCVIAINGEAGVSPQANNGLGTWRGHMMANGKTVMTEITGNPRPFLSFTKDNAASFTAQTAKDRSVSADAFNVIWGRMDAVVDGVVQTAAERDRQPRTAMGISKDGEHLILMVVDGRQQQWSVGYTRGEVGTVLAAFGAYNGMLCDEGGSSCFYIKKFNGIVNSPSDGVERTTYTHFGISLRGPAMP